MAKKSLLLYLPLAVVAFLLMSAYSFTSQAAETQDYFDYELVYLPLGEFISADVIQINDKDVMVGTATDLNGSKYAVKWDKGEIARLDLVTDIFPNQEYDESQALDINDNGQFLWVTKKKLEDGTYKNVNVIWDNKGLKEVVQESGLICTNDAIGRWITNSEEVVGKCSTVATGNTGEGFILQDGVRSRIGTLYGVMSIVEDVSHSGYITGFSVPSEEFQGVQTFLYYKGNMVNITPNLEDSSFPSSVNEKGDVVGYFQEDGFYWGYLTKNNKFERLKYLTEDKYVMNLADFVDDRSRVYGQEHDLLPDYKLYWYVYDNGKYFITEDANIGVKPIAVSRNGVFIGNSGRRPVFWIKK